MAGRASWGGGAEREVWQLHLGPAADSHMLTLGGGARLCDTHPTKARKQREMRRGCFVR